MGLSQDESMKETLLFKGGTVLKKAYYSDYRLSEDLDFTFIGEVFDSGAKMIELDLRKVLLDAVPPFGQLTFLVQTTQNFLLYVGQRVRHGHSPMRQDA